MRVRYEVVRWWLEDGEFVDEVLARVVDVDGLFADPVPPERERLVLRGCTVAPDELTGDFHLSVSGSQWWLLGDLVVHAELPGGDLVASACVSQLIDGGDFGTPPAYTLYKDLRETGTCRAVEGFPRSFESVWPPVTLIGCDNPGRIRPSAPVDEQGPWVGLRALDRGGRIVAHAGVALDVASTSPSAAGEGLFDVVLDQSRYGEDWTVAERPTPAARGAWRVWMEGVPAERNLWAPLSPEGRMWWNEIAAKAPRTRPTAGVHHVDGRHATDEFGLHLALSEALVGPGRFLGSVYAITGMYEEWWFVPGITLVWHEPGVAFEAMPDYFLGLLKNLRRNGVDVVLESSTEDLADRLDRCVELGAFVDRWIAGWARAQEVEPHDLLDNWHVWADLPGREEERILAGDANVMQHAEDVELQSVPTWLTVATDSPDEVTRVVEQAGLVARTPETFMRRGLFDHPAPKPPDGYSVRVTPGDVIEVVVTFDGEEAASGLIAVVGEDAVPHRIETKPAHRRRGLGSVVMGALVQEAVKAGASDGLLFATEEGLHLYRKLGWDTISDVVIAANDKGEA
ncbi:GNAT family N-acetyltransferase [Lentzea sp. NPDC102401]|uniref:GNAT family N-acetyltransferase n=1 Tax=Lentzea sp. NPDC102401 TaxID=3364128 RepID=UPI00381A27BE